MSAGDGSSAALMELADGNGLAFAPRAELPRTGDGLTRGDSIALVGGADGPTATAEFDVSAPGPSAALDRYAATLAAELRAGSG